MSSPLENPIVRYGAGFASAGTITFFAFTVADGTSRWIWLGIAIVEIFLVPHILREATENAV
ncbi:hypothetical protein [Natrinema halophilum]|uniref:Uncharacterized protein n=1 Tax=Natrinema halophilum TaxID=1699371 RepID=A0A7D5KBH2_9EURY|nr:hypothetical protein [Natrinema halophilum]QLG47816.1 hypothetical protein HYG82_02630 [Natrinema halophilum]